MLISSKEEQVLFKLAVGLLSEIDMKILQNLWAKLVERNQIKQALNLQSEKSGF